MPRYLKSTSPSLQRLALGAIGLFLTPLIVVLLPHAGA